MNLFIFDIETVPDVAGGRRVYDLGDLDDGDAAKAMQQIRRQRSGSDFLRPHLHRIVAIALIIRRDPDHLEVRSIGDEHSDERELIRQFYVGVGKYTPTLVSWNGTHFDLPVLHYRALLHGVAAPRYWELGDRDREFRYNSYLSRFHWRHTDLMDALAGFSPRATAPLDEIATLLGFPGKMGMDGSKVWDAYRAGNLAGIRNYCETDVLNTYLVYLRFQLMRGQLNQAGYRDECRRLRALLDRDGGERPHLNEFLQTWAAAGDV